MSEPVRPLRTKSTGGSMSARRLLMSDDLYAQIFEAQGGVCAICKHPETVELYGKTKPLCVDHDHTTHLVRGLLCSRCNVGLGYFQDNLALLAAASAYLAYYQEHIATFLETQRSEGTA